MEDSPSWAGYGDALSSGLSNEQAIKVLTRTTGFGASIPTVPLALTL